MLAYHVAARSLLALIKRATPRHLSDANAAGSGVQQQRSVKAAALYGVIDHETAKPEHRHGERLMRSSGF